MLEQIQFLPFVFCLLSNIKQLLTFQAFIQLSDVIFERMKVKIEMDFSFMKRPFPRKFPFIHSILNDDFSQRDIFQF